MFFRWHYRLTRFQQFLFFFVTPVLLLVYVPTCFVLYLLQQQSWYLLLLLLCIVCGSTILWQTYRHLQAWSSRAPPSNLTWQYLASLAPHQLDTLVQHIFTTWNLTIKDSGVPHCFFLRHHGFTVGTVYILRQFQAISQQQVFQLLREQEQKTQILYIVTQGQFSLPAKMLAAERADLQLVDGAMLLYWMSGARLRAACRVEQRQ